MEKQEQWIKWEPLNNLAEKYYIDSISEDAQEFKILLSDSSDERKKIQIIFDGVVLSYRNTDESFRQSLIHDLSERYGTKFYSKWTFFKVINSTYVHWLSAQSYGFSDAILQIHFSIITANPIVDIVATYEPKVEFLT